MAVKITQCHGQTFLSGKRFSSFAGKTQTATVGGDAVSFYSLGEEMVRKHHYPRTSSHYGNRHHHGFSLLSWLRPAGAISWQP